MSKGAAAKQLAQPSVHAASVEHRQARGKSFLVDVSDIYFFFFLLGEGKGEFEAPGEGGGVGFY